MEFTTGEISMYYAARVPDLKQTETREWRGACPVHQGKNPNFTVNAETGFAHCHSQCGRGWDLIGLEMAIGGKAFPEAKADVFRTLGRPGPAWNERDIEAMFNYVDQDGALLYQVVRRTGKRFSQRRPDGRGGFTWGLGNVTPVPFRLPGVVKAQRVFIAEGERDVLTLERFGFVATCNNGGALHFKPELAPWFIGKDLGVLHDNDEKGRAHALKVAEMLKPVAASVRIVELPNLPEKGDVSDFAAAGGTAEQIESYYQQATEWTPEWQFSSAIPVEGDRYVRRFAEVVEEAGGLDAFWDFTKQEGIPTPFPRLTRALGGGFRNGEVYVLGGNTGCGKTSLGLQFILSALQARRGVLLFSLEMDHNATFQRLCSIQAKVDLIGFRELQKHGRTTEEYKAACRRLATAGAEIDGLPLLVSTKGSITPDFLISESERLKRRQRVDFIAIDHLQLMAGTGSPRGDYEKFTSISRALKRTAMELGVPTLLLSQTSRMNSSEKRTELDISDLRGSGAIEEDAAAVLLLYPDSEDKARTLGAQTFAKGPVKSWLKLGKNRFGLQGSYLPLMHYKTTTQFAPYQTGQHVDVEE